MGNNDNEAGTASVVSVIQSAAERIRADLQKVHPVEEGTVMRWKSVDGQGNRYSYAAIFAAGLWHTTAKTVPGGGGGNRYFDQTHTHDDLMKRLHAHGHQIVDLEVAETFTKIEI